MKDIRPSAINDTLGYSDLIFDYFDFMGNQMDRTEDEIFNYIRCRGALYKFNLMTRIQYGNISLLELSSMHKTLFGFELRITHKLRMYNEDKHKIVLANNAISYTSRDVLHEKVMVDDHLTFLANEIDGGFDYSSLSLNTGKDYFSHLYNLLIRIDKKYEGMCTRITGIFGFDTL